MAAVSHAYLGGSESGVVAFIRQRVSLAHVLGGLLLLHVATVLWQISQFVYAAPTEPPSEAFRVVHPQQFSIVKPEGWNSQVRESYGIPEASDAIIIVPATKARYHETLTVSKLPTGHVGGATKSAPSAFAYEGVIVSAEQADEYYRWRFELTASDADFRLDLMLPNNGNGAVPVPEYWWPYLNSFRPGPVADGTSSR